MLPASSLANPLIAQPGMSDPHVLVEGDTVWLFTGHDVGHAVADWVMPDWRIYRSEDLRSWEQVGTIDPADTYLGKGSKDCWAGDVVARGGRYYWYFSDRNRSIGVMVADHPAGPWRDALGGPLVKSFDPSIFVDDDGSPYLIWGHGDYRIARLDESMIRLAEEPRLLELDRRGIFPVMDKNSLHKHAGVYYLSCSGHYATSASPYGPYVAQGCVGNGYQLESPYAHGDFFQWRGQWFHVWCRYRDRRIDRVRDCLIAPAHHDENGVLRDDLRHLSDSPELHGAY
jgi:arabinoxylan arabinofuranohydrolase